MCLLLFNVLTCGSDVKQSACNAGDPGSIPALGRSLRKWNGYQLQYCCLKNSMDKGVWGGNSPWGCKESDMTEQLTISFHFLLYHMAHDKSSKEKQREIRKPR